MSEVIEAEEENIAVSPEVYLDMSYELHRNFNKEHWRGKESFHNEEHIRAVSEASNKLIDAAIEGDDPMRLQEDLDKWNQMNPDVQIHSLEEFSVVTELAIASHDWGNIMEDLEVSSGQIKPQYHEGYKSAGAEDRSKTMVAKVIADDKNIAPKDKDRYTRLAQHLHEQTKFVVGEEQLREKDEVPFAKFMMVVDQIGNDLFSENDQRVNGLTEEFAYANPDQIVNLKNNYDFIHSRFPQLIPDEMTRKRILKICGAQMPGENLQIKAPPMRAEDLANLIRMIKHEGIEVAEKNYRTKDGKKLDELTPSMRGWDYFESHSEEENIQKSNAFTIT